MTILEEVLSCQRIVKAFSREDYENERLTSSLDRYFRGAVRLGWLQSNFIAVMNTILFLALAGLFWYGGQQVLAGRLTPGALISFVLYGVFLVAPVVGLSRQFTQFQNALGASDRIFNLLETQPEVLDHPDAYDLPRIQGRIEINNLSFAYGGNPDRPVLRHINLSIEPGETVAIVGPSGAGKTTLINLIPRFYEIPPGIILIDGHDITAVRQRSLRAKMAIVPQEATLFSGTIADNIRYGDLQADQAAIESAARAANAHQFIEKLEQGYDTRVGERGIKLSGGQRQRIAIARAILRDPRLLILDEATSALDNESEMLVQEALKRLMADRTTLVIAHRLTTIEDADRILVFQDGELHEQGNHQQLMLRNGLYHRLYTRNFEDEDYDQSDPNHISTSESVIHSNTTNS
jgi:subfamily B ATP-binding cassette protein MsbA